MARWHPFRALLVLLFVFFVFQSPVSKKYPAMSLEPNMMNVAKDSLRIDQTRLRADFEALAQIGATRDGGVHRPALGEAHLAARAWFRERAEADGLGFRTDGAGNHSACLACGPPGAPILLLGSHLDSVPRGGRYDGALGVLAALEVLRVVQETGLALPVHLEAIDFTDEEGTLVGLLGSAALAGTLDPDELRQPRGGREVLAAGFARAGLTDESVLGVRRDPATLAGYLELHVEQGARLVDAGVDVGVVTGIVGYCSYRLTFTGQANHAGTTSMAERADAAQGACAFTLRARELVMADYAGGVVNVGDMHFSPGAYNIIPGAVALALEFRSPEAETLDRLEADLLALAREQAATFGLGLEVAWQGRCEPALLDARVQSLIAQAADGLGLSHVSLPSGAGHDAQSLARVCPAGMLFVPSVGGVSHSPDEFTRWADCVNGANVLLQTVLRWARLDSNANLTDEY
ncbi:MAG TPA: Zn-dependent hydrolase [Chloroflexi bacterium]|nr:Zn-dependent hydrolase [Chloroflexota bacterium]